MTHRLSPEAGNDNEFVVSLEGGREGRKRRGGEGREVREEGGREEGGEGGRGRMTVIHIILMDHNIYITMTSRIT